MKTEKEPENTHINSKPSAGSAALSPPVTRRQSFLLAGQAAIVVGLGGVIRFLGPRSTLLRPPGAVAEDEFLALCIKCRKCQEVCPTEVIDTVLVTENSVRAGVVKLNFRQGYCNLCMDCIPVCPTGALQPIQKEDVRLGVAEVVRERCVAWVWKGCSQCYDECPFDAITLDNHRRPIVDANKCNGCGLCEYICPSASFRAYTHSSGKGIVVFPLGA